ncbi:MAG: SDR family oxidoreductase, partial [Patescibacteria group bacterium]|nr:SDR family oxidoreductase [Patescibacteria group bacterium]
IGGAGYIGSRLVPALLAQDHEVTVFDLFWFGDYLPPPSVNLRKVKADAASLTENDLKGFDCVVWLAGLSNDPMAEFSPLGNFIHNSAIASYIAYISKRAGVRRFIHGGSCSVYGDASDLDHKASYEDIHKLKVTYPYGIAKLQAEIGAMKLADDNFNVICLRKGTVSGWSPRMRFDLLINTMFMSAMTTNTITVNNAYIWRPILGINDAIRMYCYFVNCDNGKSRIYNIVSENVKILDVALRIASMLNPSPNVIVKNIEDKRNYRADNEGKLDENVETIVTDLIENCCKSCDGQFDWMKDDRYYNIKTFKNIEFSL